MRKEYIFILLLILQISVYASVKNDTMPNWYKPVRGYNHTIVIPLTATPQIDNYSLKAGDYVGVFYDSLGIKVACAGYIKWTGSSNVAIAAFGDDPETSDKKEGLGASEQFQWKLWKKSDKSEYFAAAQFSSGPTTYVSNGMSIVKNMANIIKPSWNYTTTAKFHTIILPKALNVIIGKVKRTEPIFVGGFYDSVGTQACAGYGDWDGTADKSFKIYGDIASTTTKEGFSINETIKFRLFLVSERKVLEVKAKKKSTSVNDTLFVENGSTTLDSLIEVRTISSGGPGWRYLTTGDYHLVKFIARSAVRIDGNPISDGDYIGAFYKKTDDSLACAGFVKWAGDTANTLTVWGDYSITTAKEGFSVGEKLNLIIWRQASQSCFQTRSYYNVNRLIYPNDSLFQKSSKVDTVNLKYGYSGVDSLVNTINEKYYIYKPFGDKGFIYNDVKLTSSYRMLSFPGIPVKSNQYMIDSLFQGAFLDSWIAFAWKSSDGFIIYDINKRSQFKFTPGKAFWTLSKVPLYPNKTLVTNVPMTQVLLNDKIYSVYDIPLDTTGNLWTTIANPYNTSIEWAKAIEFNNLNNKTKLINGVDKIYYYDRIREDEVDYKSQTYLEPYKGYFFYNRNRLKTLRIPYLPAGTEISRKASANDNSEITFEVASISSSKLNISFSNKSQNSLDENDELMPPLNFRNVELFSENSQVGLEYNKMKIDSRYLGKGQRYVIKLLNNTNSIQKLNTTISNLTAEYKAILINTSNGKNTDLREASVIDIPASKDTLSYVLLVGTKDFIEGNDVLPKSYSLMQNYPNPFNPSTNITFSLPVVSNVNLNIYSITGQLVKSIITNNNMNAGYYTIKFNASDFASGVYIYQLKAVGANTNFTQAKKMILIK